MKIGDKVMDDRVEIMEKMIEEFAFKAAKNYNFRRDLMKYLEKRRKVWKEVDSIITWIEEYSVKLNS